MLGLFALSTPPDNSATGWIGSGLLLFAVYGLMMAAARALNVRAFRNADRGVPIRWTNPPPLGKQPDARMRRIEETITACEPPMDADHDMALKAARARSEDLILVALPLLIAGGLAIATLILQAAGYGVLFGGFSVVPIVVGLFMVVMARRYVLAGRLAQDFMKRYGSVDAASDVSAK